MVVGGEQEELYGVCAQKAAGSDPNEALRYKRDAVEQTTVKENHGQSNLEGLASCDSSMRELFS